MTCDNDNIKITDVKLKNYILQAISILESATIGAHNYEHSDLYNGAHCDTHSDTATSAHNIESKQQHIYSKENTADNFCCNGFEAWVVGGYIRDTIIGCSSTDVDITTNARPDTVKTLFETAGWGTAETGIKHGTITVIEPKTHRPIEITTYRTENTYTDNRHPDSVKFVSNLQEDLARRDFTINAIAYHPLRGFSDPYGGVADIKSKIIRAVGNPRKRFEEDSLRILRAARFSSQLGFEIENQTFVCMLESKDLLANLSSERIYNELTKLICGTHAKRTLMQCQKIIVKAIPELLPCIGFDQHTKYHCFDVYEHIAHTVLSTPINKHIERGKPIIKKTNEILRWTALLHDIGKPEVFFTDTEGNGHFYGHPKVSEKLAGNIMNRLKFSKEYKRAISSLVRWHDNPTKPTIKSVRKMLGRLPDVSKDIKTEHLFVMLCDIRRADSKAHAAPYNKNTKEIDAVENVFIQMLRENVPYKISHLAIDGSDIIQAGINPGPIINELLNDCLACVINNQLQNDRTHLINYVQKRAKKLCSKNI